MFAFARSLIRHKVGVVAVLAFAVFTFTRDGDEAQKPSSPWSKQSAVSAAASSGDKDSILGGTVDKAVTDASDYIGEATGINPVEMKDQTVGSWDKTAEAYKQANNK